MADEKEAAAEAPKKKSKMMLIIIVAAVVLLGGGGGAFFMLKGSKADAAPKELVKGTSAVTMDDALTINLADGHYLKLAFTLQETADAGKETIDNSEAIDVAIMQFSGMNIDQISDDKGIEKQKAVLLKKIQDAYYEKETKVQPVYDIYITQFVTQ